LVVDGWKLKEHPKVGSILHGLDRWMRLKKRKKMRRGEKKVINEAHTTASKDVIFGFIDESNRMNAPLFPTCLTSE
jgi:hypothetical protein